MRRKEDLLPRGVRWAVRLLRFFGTVIILPVLCPIPFILPPALVKFGSSRALDMLWITFCLPIGLGGAMRVAATSIEMSHDPSIADSDPMNEWMNFAMTAVCVLAIGFILGGLVPVIRLGVAWTEKSPEIPLHLIHLFLHLGLLIVLNGVSRGFAGWFRSGIVPPRTGR